jgi:carbohydrate-selective porin OprB
MQNTIDRGRRRRQFCLAIYFWAFLEAGPSQAQGVTDTGLPANSIAQNWPNNGDPYGTRKWLYDNGLSYQLIWTNDALSNLSGGIRSGTIYQGKLETQVYIDLEKLAGWKNWSFYANTFAIYNNGRIRRDYVGGMNTIAAIEATPNCRNCGSSAGSDRLALGLGSSQRMLNSFTAT